MFASLLEKKIDQFKPSPYFTWMIHLDGLRERHDAVVCRDGTFDKAVAAIKVAQKKGFRVGTNTTFFDPDDATAIRGQLPAVSAGGTTYGPADFAKAVADIHAGKDINYDGASGNVDFDSSGDVKAPYDIWKVQGGAITVIESGVNP